MSKEIVFKNNSVIKIIEAYGIRSKRGEEQLRRICSMNNEKDKDINILAEYIETYLKNNSYKDLAKIIYKNIPKQYYNRLSYKLHCKNSIEDK